MNSEVLHLFPEFAEESSRRLSENGLLPSQKLEELIACGHIRASTPILSEQIQPCSIDLRLGPVAYQVKASFLPNARSTVARKLADLTVREISLGQPALLRTNEVYIAPLKEELLLPDYLSAKANPKSTTGRLDVFTRLITDYGTEFDVVPQGYKGGLYAEIVPRTFRLKVREGARLNQLRLARGKPLSSDAMLRRLHKEEPILYSRDDQPLEPYIKEGMWLRVDLAGADSEEIVGYKARKNAPEIEFERKNYYDPLDFWEPISRPSSGQIILHPEDFYILGSKDKVSIPPQYAAEMIPFDPSVGEFRIHYAGFFDPGFGYGRGDIKSTRAVLEVRSHGVPFVLEDGQIVGRLEYEQLIAHPSKLYGRDIGSSYQSQGLSLSKQFKRQ